METNYTQLLEQYLHTARQVEPLVDPATSQSLHEQARILEAAAGEGEALIQDLTSSDQDRLAPHVRLLFAGLLTMLIGILLALDLIDLSIGSVSLTDITDFPLLAFLVGAFCGISKLSLPASIGNCAGTLIKP
jgi:hypothetical protein